jgi:hypothetical protein
MLRAALFGTVARRRGAVVPAVLVAGLVLTMPGFRAWNFALTRRPRRASGGR